MNFYVLKPFDNMVGWKSHFYYASIEEPIQYGSHEICPNCSGPVTPRKLIPPYYISLESNNPNLATAGDFLFTENKSFFISGNMKNIIQSEQIKGLEIESSPAHIKTVARIPLEEYVESKFNQYYYTQIHYGGGSIDIEKSGYEYWEKPECELCQVSVLIRAKGQILRDGSWEGSDIFYPRGGLVPLVTEKFKNIMKSNMITNCSFYPAETWWKDE